jgi:hypothetical protein
MNTSAPPPSFRLAGLLFGCPFTTAVKGCPLQAVWRKPPPERVRWLLALSALAQRDLLARHSACRAQRSH